MKNGLYVAMFKTQIGHGAGVAVLENGIIRGGDSTMFYVGTYQIDGDEMSAIVSVDVHTQDPNFESVLGLDKATITLTGSIAEDTGTLTGTVAQVAGVSISATLKFLDA